MPMMTGRPEPMRWKMGKSWSRVARAVRIRETWIIRVLSALLRPQVSATRMAGVMTADYGGDHVLESQREEAVRAAGCRAIGKRHPCWWCRGDSFQSPHKNFLKYKCIFSTFKLYPIFRLDASGISLAEWKKTRLFL